MIRHLLAAAFALAALAARADAPAEVVASLDTDPRRLGAGTVTFWGFSLYDAELWTEDGAFDFDRPFALSLTYKRPFTASELAAASVKEMARVSGRDSAAFAPLGPELERCFADVSPGDRITGLSRDADRASFFFNGAPRCKIEWPGFARAFFGIWLGEKTRDAAVRDRLLGAAR